MFKHKRYFGEFLASEEKIATNILSSRLRLLEDAGLVSKRSVAKAKNKNIYELTAKGFDLAPMLIEMILWSAKHDPETEATKSFLAQARRDRSKLLAEIRRKAG